MPLNEWPSIMLKGLLFDVTIASNQYIICPPSTKKYIDVIEQAIKDAQEREAKLPFK